MNEWALPADTSTSNDGHQFRKLKMKINIKNLSDPLEELQGLKGVNLWVLKSTYSNLDRLTVSKISLYNTVNTVANDLLVYSVIIFDSQIST